MGIVGIAPSGRGPGVEPDHVLETPESDTHQRMIGYHPDGPAPKDQPVGAAAVEGGRGVLALVSRTLRCGLAQPLPHTLGHEGWEEHEADHAASTASGEQDRITEQAGRARATRQGDQTPSGAAAESRPRADEHT